ncbi:MAG: response regulator [Desulfoprunum sp.]|nr:response regulator [Desulfoprunum sp.]
MISKNKRAGQHAPLAETINSSQMDSFRQGSRQAGLILRQQTEETLLEKATTSPKKQEALSSKETQQALQALQVHQVELKLQNEELRRAQAELDATKERYFDLYDTAPVGYCTINGKGQILEANLTAATLLGMARGELESLPITRFILKEDQDIYYLHSKQLFASHSALRQDAVQAGSRKTGELQEYELRIVKKDGTTFWAHLKVTAVRAHSTDSTGSPQAEPQADSQADSEHEANDGIVYRVMLSDITERKQAEAQRINLEEQNRQIQKAESLECMAGAIAHLFNNQLCVVLANLEMTLEDMVGDALPRQNLVDAMQAARRSSEISGLLLTYLGQNNGKPDPLDLSVFCRNNLPRFQAAIPDGIAIETDFMTPGPVVSANANQLQQVLSHLLTNGWEAIGDRTGRVTVTTKTFPAADIPTSHIFPIDWQSSAESFACLEVKDTGGGMTDQKMDKIFDPFFTTKFTGRGLGLAVVIGLVKTWGGMIGVESEVGKGSIFRIFLPLVTAEVPLQTEMSAEPWNFNTGWTVLLVDDDYIVRNLIETVLNRLGITVFAAAGGNEALALFQQHQGSIHCLFTDLSMPDMNGWETLAALRKIEPGLPAILSSGYDETQAMSGDYAELPQAFLHKPFEINELKRVLNRVLGKVNTNTH